MEYDNFMLPNICISLKKLTQFHQMQQNDQFTFPSILKACTKLGDLQHGSYIYQRLFKTIFLQDVVVVSDMLDMYEKYEIIYKEHELLGNMHYENTISWTLMIIGNAQNGYVERAHELFDKMPKEKQSHRLK